MTNKEQQTIDSLYASVQNLRTENSKFREDLTTLVTAINTKTDQKHLPVVLERDILNTAQAAIQNSIKTILEAYGSPLHKLTAQVVEQNSAFLKTLISDCFNTVIRTEDFKLSIINAFSHKVARAIISNNDGLYDKVSNELKQDVVFKSKMAMAVANVVEECLKEKNS